MRISHSGAAAALPDFAMGLLCLIVWVRPGLLYEGALSYVMLLMLLEFIVIHSSAFLGTAMFSDASPQKKVTQVLGLGGFYTLFVAGFALAFKTFWPLASFWGQMANRMMGAWLGKAPSAEQKLLIQRGWGATCMFYLLGCFATVLLPIPPLGITPEIVALADLPGSGLWIDQPWRVAAFGFLYFTAVGWSELHEHRWLQVPTEAKTQRPRKAA